MKFQDRHGEGGTLSEINIIPLVDIMLVLLIIFMVAAPLLQQGVDVDLPQVDASAVKASEEDFILSINKQNQIFLGDDKKTKYSIDNLKEKLGLIFENKKKKEIYLHADKTVSYGFVVKVMALCQQAGIDRVGMITNPEDLDQKSQKK